MNIDLIHIENDNLFQFESESYNIDLGLILDRENTKAAVSDLYNFT